MGFELEAQKRVAQGSGASRRLRRAGKVPGILYGGTEEPIPIELDHNALFLALRKEAFHSSIVKLKIEGSERSILLRDAQMHPYKQQVLHIDFLRIDENRVIYQKVPLHFINGDISLGVKRDAGAVSHAMNEIEVACLPKDLPAFVEVDLKDLQAGHSLNVSQIVFPEGVRAVPHTDEDPVVATIVVVRKEETAADSDEASVSPAVSEATSV
ncbi:MAG: 50S ribosomal protein L25/general stress protein Ctc [Candidatus Accumulibacter sp.]|jgi:large subunit ribosomal protein L25|nr:50S ribosomal protein L25/general stress protein Ctc [Accumulibacter sp.]